MKRVMIKESRAKDFAPLFAGHRVCEKDYINGPHARSYYLIHFCINGSGELFDKFGNHKIRAGELFIIRPDEITTYIADKNDPWEYSWIGFEGDMADIFDTGKSVYPFPMEVGLSVQKLVEERVKSPSIFISLIHRLAHELLDTKQEDDLVESIKRYIKFNYMSNISVSKISKFFNFERSYLYRTFYAATGTGIKDYITKTRLEQANILLKNGYSVSAAANSVGYKDPFNFSKAYKRFFGFAPKESKG